MNQNQILEILTRINVLIADDHIVYTSGRHGSSYVNKDAIYPHTEITSKLCHEIAQAFAAENPDVVVAPAIGAVILSQWVAYHLTQILGREVYGVYAEKNQDGDGFVIKRGYDEFIRSKKILIVEDIITTGGSVKKVVETVRALDGNIVGIGALCNRGGITPEQIGSVPKLTALVNISLESWEPSECPLCTKKVPINTKVGKGSPLTKN